MKPLPKLNGFWFSLRKTYLVASIQLKFVPNIFSAQAGIIYERNSNIVVLFPVRNIKYILYMYNIRWSKEWGINKSLSINSC